MGIPIFVLKHRLWVFDRTARRGVARRGISYMSTINVLSKNKKNIKIFLIKFLISNLCILHEHLVFIMLLLLIMI